MGKINSKQINHPDNGRMLLALWILFSHYRITT